MFEYLFEIRPVGPGWRLSSPSLPRDLVFETLDQAERRARWLAVRQEVRGFAALIRIMSVTGELVGTWRGERYEPEACEGALRHAA